MIKPNGIILYEGPSMLDGSPIVMVAIGLRQKSTNSKTGAMIQTYILRQDMPPIEAVKTGADESICGSCVHRGDGTGKRRSCYVTLIHGPRGVYNAYKNGRYLKVGPAEARKLLSSRMVRLGTYGDPAAVPLPIIRNAVSQAKGWTGYTHQWRTAHWRWRELVMASADSLKDMDEAHAKGYRTFRVSPVGTGPVRRREFNCPASEEAGKKIECIDCMACMGTSAPHSASVQIAAHGTGKGHVQAAAD